MEPSAFVLQSILLMEADFNFANKLVFGSCMIDEAMAQGEIPQEFFDSEATVEILFFDPEGEPYRAINPDSLYKLTKSEYIALPVKLFGLHIWKC